MGKPDAAKTIVKDFYELSEEITMKFRFEKLGCIEKAEIELGDLTILCGDNNAGKTYISYAIYGFLTAWDTNIVFKEKKLAKQL
jgi:predicted ATPase